MSKKLQILSGPVNAQTFLTALKLKKKSYYCKYLLFLEL